MTMVRTARATWRGNLLEGSGSAALDSGAAGEELELTWRARTDAADGKTSPEELIAAAHASCFSMSLAHALSEAGHEPEQLETSADVTFDKTDDGWRITSVALRVTGKAGLGEDEFKEFAETAKVACPVSNALRGNVEIGLEASLSS